MKRFILPLLVLFSSTITVLGQTDTKKISYTTNLGTGLPMSSPAHTPFIWEVMGHYHLNQRFAMGVGTGLSVYEKSTYTPLCKRAILRHQTQKADSISCM